MNFLSFGFGGGKYYPSQAMARDQTAAFMDVKLTQDDKRTIPPRLTFLSHGEVSQTGNQGSITVRVTVAVDVAPLVSTTV